jgi:hypothetical protein
MKPTFLFGLTLMSLTVSAQSLPLVEPINSSFCVAQITAGDGSIVTAEKVHYFHQDRFDPDPLPQNSAFTGFCHDRQTYGDVDSALYPRLGFRAEAFNVFSSQLPNQEMVQILARSNPLSPDMLLGFAVAPTVSGFDVYCPEIDGIQTETLYALTPTPTRNFGDVIMASRSELERGWFFMKNGVATKPSSARDYTRTLYVYWPINPASPFVRSAGQELYKIIYYNIGTSPDRALGCVPTLNSPAENETLSTGESCRVDTECSTLLCSRYTQRCATSAEGHPRGSECFASSQCQSEVVNILKLTYVGTDPVGGVLCRDIATSRRMNGACLRNTCTPPSDFREAADSRCIQ